MARWLDAEPDTGADGRHQCYQANISVTPTADTNSKELRSKTVSDRCSFESSSLTLNSSGLKGLKPT